MTLPPQPRESSYAHHPNTGPGAEGGGGWPLQATAQPWHAEGSCRRLQRLSERLEASAIVICAQSTAHSPGCQLIVIWFE
jgi:hypothetical protein